MVVELGVGGVGGSRIRQRGRNLPQNDASAAERGYGGPHFWRGSSARLLVLLKLQLESASEAESRHATASPCSPPIQAQAKLGSHTLSLGHSMCRGDGGWAGLPASSGKIYP